MGLKVKMLIFKKLTRFLRMHELHAMKSHGSGLSRRNKTLLMKLRSSYSGNCRHTCFCGSICHRRRL